MKAKDWPSLMSSVHEELAKTELIEAKIHADEGHIKDAAGLRAEAKAASDSKVRYQNTKEAQKFKAKGVKSTIASIGSRMFWTIEHNPESDLILKETPLPWQTQDVHIIGQFEALDEVLAFYADSIKDQAEKAVIELGLQENGAARGIAKPVVATNIEEVTQKIDELDHFTLKPIMGLFRPHVNCHRNFTMRTGNTALAFSAQGMFIKSMNAQLTITAIDLALILSKIGISNLEKFEDVFEERIVQRVHWLVFEVPKDHTVWIPFGTVPFISAKEPDIFQFVVVPWLHESLHDTVDCEVQDLVFAAFAKFLKVAKSKPTWVEIAAEWNKFRAKDA